MNTKYVKGNTMFNKNKSLEVKYNYLSSDIEADIAIIGGGITGAILGYYFSENNIKSVILEKERIGYGSTSISTALLQYELDNTIGQLSGIKKEEDVIKAYKLGIEALKKIEEIINENGNKCEYLKRDTLLYSNKKEDIKCLKEEFEKRQKNGLDVEFIDSSQTRYPFSIKAGVISKEGGAEINPYLFTNQLIEIGINKNKNQDNESNLSVFENTKVENIIYNKDNVEVITSYGNKVKVKKVIIATGYDIEEFTSQKLGNKSITYNVVTEKIEEEKINKEYNGDLIRDTNDPYNYYRKTVDNRIIVGGEDEEVNDNNYSEKKANEKYKILEEKLKQLFPSARNKKIEYSYCRNICINKRQFRVYW